MKYRSIEPSGVSRDQFLYDFGPGSETVFKYLEEVKSALADRPNTELTAHHRDLIGEIEEVYRDSTRQGTLLSSAKEKLKSLMDSESKIARLDSAVNKTQNVSFTRKLKEVTGKQNSEEVVGVMGDLISVTKVNELKSKVLTEKDNNVYGKVAENRTAELTDFRNSLKEEPRRKGLLDRFLGSISRSAEFLKSISESNSEANSVSPIKGQMNISAASRPMEEGPAFTRVNGIDEPVTPNPDMSSKAMWVGGYTGNLYERSGSGYKKVGVVKKENLGFSTDDVKRKYQSNDSGLSEQNLKRIRESKNMTDSEKERMIKAIGDEAKAKGIDPNLIASLIKRESSFSSNPPDAGAGAVGPMQVKETTAAEVGVNKGDLNTIEGNIKAGVAYLKKQIDSFGSIELGLAAYNAGPGTVSSRGVTNPSYVKDIMDDYRGSGEAAGSPEGGIKYTIAPGSGFPAGGGGGGTKPQPKKVESIPYPADLMTFTRSNDKASDALGLGAIRKELPEWYRQEVRSQNRQQPQTQIQSVAATVINTITGNNRQENLNM